MKMQLVVEYEDGKTEEVSVGQRDVAKWEAEPFGGSKAMEEKPLTFARYLAWSALRRTGGTIASWSAWDDTVDSVETVEQDDEADPTNADQPITA